MGFTLAEKMLAKAADKKEVKAGEIIWANVDVALMHDLLGPKLIDGLFRRLGGKFFDKEKVVVVSDHGTPPGTVEQANDLKLTRDWVREFDLPNFYEYQGPCHQVIIEEGFALPGNIILGTDSHTCMAGGVGAFGTGIGSTEMVGVLLTGKTWLKVPESIKVHLEGKIPEGIYSKDLILKIIKDLGHAGATYQAIEFTGESIDNMSLEQRLTITNMAVEAGAKTGLISPDKKTIDYLINEVGVEITDSSLSDLKSDNEASFIKELNYDVAKLEPQVACPHDVDNVYPVSEVEGVRIDKAYLGSCTNGRISDLRIAAEILKGRKIAKNIHFQVVPASKSIWEQAVKEGIFEILSEAGATISAASCAACGGFTNGIAASGEVIFSSSNRNFKGRMGSPKAEVYLGSPAAIAASAIEGKITDPRKYLIT